MIDLHGEGASESESGWGKQVSGGVRRSRTWDCFCGMGGCGLRRGGSGVKVPIAEETASRGCPSPRWKNSS